jgi:hypothetical protein
MYAGRCGNYRGSGGLDVSPRPCLRRQPRAPVRQAHHPERIEQPQATGEDRDEKGYLQRQMPGVRVDADDLVLNFLGVLGELLLKLGVAHDLGVGLQRVRDLLLLGR